MWQPNGTLKIIDRRKHIFKLSQGEYIVPEKIENIYIRSQYVEQVFVYGESLKVKSFPSHHMTPGASLFIVNIFYICIDRVRRAALWPLWCPTWTC